MQTTIIVKMNQ